MKLNLCMILVSAWIGNFAIATEDPIQPVAITITKKVPVKVADFSELATYASSNSYYFAPNLREGMRVLYSASYESGEAGQAHGTVVYRNGKYWFRQVENTTRQLLLPPGLTLRSGSKDSLWDLGAYMDLVNRVAFSEPNEASRTANDVYERPEAYVVDFKGGTAGKSVTYQDALQVSYVKSVGSRSQSKLQVYYAKGIGPVSLEFTENMSPAGTFKLYIGE